MNAGIARRQRGAVTLMGALFLIVVIIVLLNVTQRMAASEIIDSALQNDAVEVLFIAESGLERAAWRYSTGSACAALAGETGNTGRGSFQVISTATVGTLCRVRVNGSITTTTAANTVRRTIEGDFTQGSTPGGAWSVGNDGGGETILNWDGSSWSRVGPYGSIPNQELFGITCVASDDCWAVGDDSGGELIIHWDGSSWSRVGPYGSIPNRQLNSISCVATDDCWAVGNRSGYENINHWDGTTWTRLGNSASISNDDMNSVYMVSATEGYMVGDDGVIASWNGSNWSGQSSPTSRDLYAVTATGGGGGGSVALVQWTEVVQ